MGFWLLALCYCQARESARKGWLGDKMICYEEKSPGQKGMATSAKKRIYLEWASG